MIIRITFHDNDYWEILEDFVNSLDDLLHTPIKLDVTEEFFSYSDYRRRQLERMKILEMIYSTAKVDNAIDYYRIRFLFKNEFIKFVKGNDSIKYLVDNFKMTIEESYKETDENREVVYWFSCKGIYITQ